MPCFLTYHGRSTNLAPPEAVDGMDRSASAGRRRPRRSVDAPCELSWPLPLRECLTAALQEVTLGRVLAAGDRRLVRGHRLGGAVQAPEQIGAYRVEKMIRIELETVDERERRRRSLDL